jgi:hypothetical protein
MKPVVYLTSVVLAIACCFSLGCGKAGEDSSSTPTQTVGNFDQQAYQKAKDEALADAQKAYEARAHGATTAPPFRLPNTFDPEQPIPDYLNFYDINDRYPAYLLCEYSVEQKDYNQSKEAGWFKAALEQVRTSGPKKFPPIQWVAVIIINRAEWKGATTFEEAHKVGAIFKASDVFNPSCNLSQLVIHTDMERHPFEYDTSQPTPEGQQRWLIVERHAATNGATLDGGK